MNAGRQPILVVNQACSCTVTQVTDQLSMAGYAVVQSFNLLSALAKHSKCLCQMVVLLVYGQDGPPATIILDGDDLSTSIFLENEPERSSRARLTTLLSPIAAIVDPTPESNFNQPTGIETQYDI